MFILSKTWVDINQSLRSILFMVGQDIGQKVVPIVGKVRADVGES